MGIKLDILAHSETRRIDDKFVGRIILHREGVNYAIHSQFLDEESGIARCHSLRPLQVPGVQDGGSIYSDPEKAIEEFQERTRLFREVGYAFVATTQWPEEVA